MYIKKGDKSKVSANFRANEFFTNAPGVESHNIDDRLIQAAQYIRSYYNVPVYISSSYRPSWYNASIGGVSNSQHIKGRAIDFRITDPSILADYSNDIAIHGPLYQALASIGISGFGLYDSFAHIDTRNGLAQWDNRKKKIIYLDSEDGLTTTKGGKWLFLSIAAVLLLFFIYIKTK